METRRFRRLLSHVLAAAAAVGAAVPHAATPFAACLDYHCDRQQQVALGEADWRAIGALFPPGLDAAGERAAIRAAVAEFEKRVGRITGTWRDLGENAAGAGLPGQLDCIAESRNTTTYLRLLEAAGLLRWHRVEDRVQRQRWLFAFHWTAVIREQRSGVAYAVDSWYLDNGEPPHVQPLEAWRQGAAFDEG